MEYLFIQNFKLGDHLILDKEVKLKSMNINLVKH